MTPEERYDLHRAWIETIESLGHGLTKWEADFVASVGEQLEERGSISDRQAEILERIYAEKTPL